MVVTHAGIAFEAVVSDKTTQTTLLIDANLLGKIPVWIKEEGDSIYDSSVIIKFLNRFSGKKLFLRNAKSISMPNGLRR